MVNEFYFIFFNNELRLEEMEQQPEGRWDSKNKLNLIMHQVWKKDDIL